MASAPSKNLTVMVVDSNQMQSQLLVGALRRRPEFRVISCKMEMNSILEATASAAIDVAIVNADRDHGVRDLTMVRRLHLARPNIAKILLLPSYDRDSVVSAFRSGI